ncbi:MAG TPA: DUF3999 family protein, partial [Roseimicrobium sp.]|nr:DUF3999 family protein [Roseimicrobium sp.]
MKASTILQRQSRGSVLSTICSMGLALGLIGAQAAVNVAEWSQRQLLPVTTAGLIRVNLPAVTLDAARPQLEDIRILDATGVERPYLVLRTAPEPGQIQNVRSKDVRLESSRTVLTLETGASGPLDAVQIDFAAPSFLKAAQLEVSSDGRNWSVIADGFPLFRQPDGTSSTTIPLNQQRWAWLRITLDDRRSAPVPVLGARIRLSPVRTVESEPVDVRLVSCDESPGETRLVYNLGAANLTVAELQMEIEDALFNRSVTIHTSVMTGDGVQEELIATGRLQRREDSASGPSKGSRLVIERQVRSREIIVRIRNLDSQPLKIRSTTATRRPVQIVFQSEGAGPYQMLCGNRNCVAPQYDLGYLGDSLKKQFAGTVAATPGPLEANPAYRIPEALAGLGTTGASIDVKPWTIHRRITTVAPGIQQLELDLDVLSKARPDFADLRIVTDGKQIPFVLENTSMSR